ncbi:hypothetical protein M2146_002552 [Lachnospiraceae bacterium PF1-22]
MAIIVEKTNIEIEQDQGYSQELSFIMKRIPKKRTYRSRFSIWV